MEGQHPDLESIDVHEFVKYIMRKNVPRGVFHLYDNAYYYVDLPHEGSISAKYHAALNELNLAQDILASTDGLEEREMRDLARHLKKAVKKK